MATHTPNTEPKGTGPAGELPADVVEGLLASRTRQRLLRRLQAAGEPIAVGDLAETLSGTDAEPGEVRTELYQRHLPQLLETGVIAFDSRLGTVEFTGGPRLAARLDGDGPEIGVRTEDK